VRRHYVEEYEWTEIGIGPIEQVVRESFQRCRDAAGLEPRSVETFTIKCTGEDDLPATWSQVWARLLDAPAGETTLPDERLMTFIAEYPGSETDEDAAWEATDSVASSRPPTRRGPGRPRAGVSADERELFEEFRFLRRHLEDRQTFESKSVIEVTRAIMRLDAIDAVLPTGESQAVAPKSWRPSWRRLPESRVLGIVRRQADKGGRIDAVPLLYDLLAAPRRMTSDAIRSRLWRLPSRDSRLEPFDLDRSQIIGLRFLGNLPTPMSPLLNLLVWDPGGRIQDPTVGRSWQLRQLAWQPSALGGLTLGR
jgi:hypothetical protein